jgi:predicted Fe-S protein YdhL (DUF1289 family)
MANDSMSTGFRAVLSPCIGVCTLDEAGFCHGCLRSTSEIARWTQMGDDERLRLMEQVLPAREAARR